MLVPVPQLVEIVVIGVPVVVKSIDNIIDLLIIDFAIVNRIGKVQRTAFLPEVAEQHEAVVVIGIPAIYALPVLACVQQALEIVPGIEAAYAAALIIGDSHSRLELETCKGIYLAF